MCAATVIILHGDDTFKIDRETAQILSGMGDPALLDLNLTRLEGSNSSLDAVYTAANAMPFLAENRVVILRNPLSRLNSEALRERFRALLGDLPETTRLVLEIEDEIDRSDWKTVAAVKKKHWLRKWYEASGGKAEWRECRLPSLRDMPGWIIKETRALGGQITPAAAAALAQHTGSQPYAACREIEKLLSYVNYARPIDVDDVELLSAQNGQANIFDMVDAIGGGNTRLALNLLHRLLEDTDEISLFAMITRQFRLLLQTREILDEGTRAADAVAQELHIHPYVATKLVGQAGSTNMPRLTAIYHRLLEIDEAVKTGQSGLPVALDTFVAELAR